MLITTRKGSARKAVVRLQTYQGFSKVEKKLDVLNTAQYLELMEELGYEDPGTYNTDWQDMVFGSGREENYQLSISGGGPGSQYFTSLGYQKRNWLVTVIKGGGWKKFNTPSNDIVRAFEEEGDNVRLNASIIYENQSGEGWTDDYWSKTKYPFINKFRDWDGRSNIYLLRLADILLLKAEALNESGDVTGAAEYVNLVRNRVDLPDVNASTQDEMRLAIENERRLELAFEGHRWFDLLRTGRAMEVMNAVTDGAGNKLYNVSEDDLLLPVPQTERDRNPNASQNDGY